MFVLMRFSLFVPLPLVALIFFIVPSPVSAFLFGYVYTVTQDGPNVKGFRDEFCGNGAILRFATMRAGRRVG